MKNYSIEMNESPFIVFKIQGSLYCVNSRHIATILQLPPVQSATDAVAHVTGMFSHRGAVVEMFDIRSALGFPTLNQEYEEFAQMLEDRKQDHINWVKELERSLMAGEKFRLATDPHKCAFGKWYDHYQFANDATAFHMRKIEEPHRRLHQAAEAAETCSRGCASCTREECLSSVLKRVKEESVQQIISLLDEAKEIFHSTVYNEMVLLVSGTGVGLVVDEVLAVEMLAPAEGMDVMQVLHDASMIAGIRQLSKKSELIPELNLSALLHEYRGTHTKGAL